MAGVGETHLPIERRLKPRPQCPYVMSLCSYVSSFWVTLWYWAKPLLLNSSAIEVLPKIPECRNPGSCTKNFNFCRQNGGPGRRLSRGLCVVSSLPPPEGSGWVIPAQESSPV